MSLAYLTRREFGILYDYFPLSSRQSCWHWVKIKLAPLLALRFHTSVWERHNVTLTRWTMVNRRAYFTIWRDTGLVPQVAYLDVLIEEYLESRKAQFPESGLKPKHHYLHHYSEMIPKFGPLIRLWTMRFERKHGYFKRHARNLKNSKNLGLKLLQVYLSAG